MLFASAQYFLELDPIKNIKNYREFVLQSG